MAELKSLGRSVGQPSAPDISGAAKVHVNLGKAVQGLANSVGSYVEKERNAALELEATFNTLTAQREMNLNLLKLKQNPNATDADLAELNKTNQMIGANILKNTSDKNKAEVTRSLMGYAIKAEASAFEYIGKAKQKNIKNNAAATLYEGTNQLEELAVSGDEEGFTATFYKLEEAQQALVEAGYLSKEDYLKNRDTMLQSGINGKLAHDYNQAFKADGERGAAKFINEFWNTEHENMTQEQKSEGLKSLLAIQAQDKSAMVQIGQAGFRDVMESITSSNPPKDENELHAFIQASKESGYPLNEYQEYKAFQAFRKTNKSKNKRNENNARISAQIATGDVNSLLNESSGDIDNNYIDTKKFLKEKMGNEAQEAQSLSGQVMAQRPEWMIGATIAAQTPVAIGQWQEEISSQLLSQNPDDILGAVSAFNYVSEQNKAAIKGISEKDQAFIKAVSNDLERTNMQPFEIIEKYKDSILNVDPKVKENRKKAYDESIKNSPGLPNKIVKKAFGEKINNVLVEPSAELYAAAQEAYQREFELTGNENQAIDNAVSYLKDNGGVSMFAQKGSPVWNPPENLPYYDFGNIVRNQATKYLRETVDSINKNPGKVPYTVEWSDKMPKFPDQVSEEDMFKGKYDKGEWWLKINGTDRRVYFISPNYNQANSFAETKYQVMYEKDGYPHTLMTITPNIGIDGQIQMSAGTAMMTFQGPTELTPNLIKKMQSEQAQGAKDKYISNEFKKLNPRDYGIDITEGPNISRLLSEKPEQKKSTKKSDKKKLEEIIESENQDLPKRIEKEKLRRQQEAAKQVINEQGQ